MRRPKPRPEGFPSRLQSVVDHWGSIDELARITEIAPRTLSDWLRGSREPHAASLQKFCRETGVDPGWLATGKEGGVDVAWRPGSPASGQIATESWDGISSITAVSRQWLY